MRKLLLVAGMIAGLFATGSVSAQDAASRLTERILGNPEAPVTMIEYSSLTCPHCANFHRDTLPLIKEKYIDSGKLKLVFRDFPFEQVSLAGAMTARCLPEGRFFPFLEMLFKTQNKWAREKNPIAGLARTARLAGMSEDGFKDCLGDSALQTKILERRQEADKKYGIQSTPSFIINGKKVTGAESFAAFERVIKAALP